MRILMLTDDALAVDRRILLEAETLIDNGHEVIVLARDDGNTPNGKFMGRVKVEFVKTNIAKPPHLNLWQVPLYSIQNYISSKLPIGNSLKNFARQMLYYQGNIGEYISTQIERITDSWIPLHRRLWILLRSFMGMILFVLFKIFANIASLFVFNKRIPTINFLDHPFQPHAWDTALIERGIFYNPDLVFSHDLPQLFAGAAIKKHLKIPLVFDSHEVYSEIGTLTPKEKKFLKAREAKYIKKCDTVMTVNPCAAKWFEDTYKVKVNSLTNATNPPYGFNRNKKYNLIRKKLKLKDDIKILSYQGWFSIEGRGLQELIEAMKYVREDVHLTMMGYGDFKFFQKLIDDHGLNGRVHLMEAVPWTELIFWAASADAGIVPYQPVDFNHVICSPNKIFEFIAAGLPFVANDLDYLRIASEGSGFGIARKMSNAKEISDAINEMFDDQIGHIARCKANILRDGKMWEWTNESKKFLQYIDGPLHYLDKDFADGSHKVKRALLPEVTIPEIKAKPIADNGKKNGLGKNNINEKATSKNENLSTKGVQKKENKIIENSNSKKQNIAKLELLSVKSKGINNKPQNSKSVTAPTKPAINKKNNKTNSASDNANEKISLSQKLINKPQQIKAQNKKNVTVSKNKIIAKTNTSNFNKQVKTDDLKRKLKTNK